MEKTGLKIDLKARGLLFKTLADWCRDNYDCDIEEKYGKDMEDEILETIKSAEKGSWYPADHLADALKTCCQDSSKSENNPGTLKEFGRYLCQVSLTTSFRGLIVFIDPMTLMKRMPLFWRRYFSGIELRAEQVSQSEAALSLAEDIGEDSIPQMFSGWLTQALEMIGAEEIKVKQKDINWDISWEWSPD